MYIYIYIYIYVCVCVCVCARAHAITYQKSPHHKLSLTPRIVGVVINPILSIPSLPVDYQFLSIRFYKITLFLPFPNSHRETVAVASPKKENRSL